MLASCPYLRGVPFALWFLVVHRPGTPPCPPTAPPHASIRPCTLPACTLQACRARGMRAPFGEGAAEFMRQQLAEWIDWSLNK